MQFTKINWDFMVWPSVPECSVFSFSSIRGRSTRYQDKLDQLSASVAHTFIKFLGLRAKEIFVTANCFYHQLRVFIVKNICHYVETNKDFEMKQAVVLVNFYLAVTAITENIGLIFNVFTANNNPRVISAFQYFGTLVSEPCVLGYIYFENWFRLV